ncbi:MAG TPA: hypothetical protein PLQ76_06300 [bacterium]|nr:hypothetical protein [bacterium]
MRRNARLATVLTIVSFVFSVLILTTPAKAAEYTPQTLWASLQKKWDGKVNSYHCKLFSWNIRTESFIKNFPKFVKPGDKVDWDYRVFDVRFKKPGKALLTYELSLNEDVNSGSLIDKGVAYMLLYTSGTALNFGYKNDDTIYIVFPYLSNKQFEKLPIALVWKAALKILMIASRKEVYWKPVPDMRDLRGNEVGDLSIGKTMKRFEGYFKTGKVTLAKSPLYTKEDYNLDKNTGYLTLKSGSKKPADIYMITMIPKDIKANKGISKVELFVDPKSMMFLGFQEYEGSKLVQVMLFSDLTVNPDLPDKLWEDYFKGRNLSDKK